MSEITNLKEFFEARGFPMEENSMYQYGRALYKYTFGPWVSYEVETEPGKEVKYTIIAKPDLEKVEFIHKPDLPRDVLRFFNIGEYSRTYSGYVALLKAFMIEHPDQTGFTVTFQEEDETRDGEPGYMGPHAVIKGTYKIPPKIHNVYYEDTDASTGTLEYADKCVGVTVGSIVEGCDFDAPPFTLYFPFTNEQYEKELDGLESYVDAAWKHCNSTFYKVVKGEESLWCVWTQFDENPEGNFDEEDWVALEIAIAAGKLLFDGKDGEVPGFPGWVVTEEEPIGFEY